MTLLRSLTLALSAIVSFSPVVMAGEPLLPTPLQNMKETGAQIHYLGNEHGLDGWVAIKNGQEQYFYVLPGGKAFLMGLLFNEEGKVVTLRQVQALQSADGQTALDLLAKEKMEAPKLEKKMESQSPAEQMFASVEGSNWITVGAEGVPVLYVFIDPQCLHCHEYLNDLRRDYVPNQMVQLRIVPVGFKDDSVAQAALLLASSNPEEILFRHLDGDKTALPVKAGIDEQGIERNLAVMQTWNFTATPMTVYRASNGDIRIVRGKPQSIPGIINEIQ